MTGRRRRCRRALSGPLLVLLGAAGFLLYRSLVRVDGGTGPARHRVPNAERDRPLPPDGRKLSAALRGLQLSPVTGGEQPRQQRAVLVIGRQDTSDSEVQLYRRVLTRLHFHVQTQADPAHRHGPWTLLLCVSSAHANCLRTAEAAFSHRRVNLLPGLMEALSAVLTAEGLPVRPLAHTAANGSRSAPRQPLTTDSGEPPGAGPVSTVSVFVLVTSLRPLSCFVHSVGVVTDDQTSRAAQISRLLPADAVEQAKRLIGHLLGAAASANEKAANHNRCVLCYQLLTFTLTFGGTIKPLVTQVEGGLFLGALSDERFERQVTRDIILEDTLDLLLSSEAADDDAQRDAFEETSGVSLSEDNFRLLRNFHRHMMAPSSFQLVCPSASRSCGSASGLSEVLLAIVQLTKNSRGEPSDAAAANRRTGRCAEPRLRQIYFAPPLALRPAFSPHVTEYRADVTFDTLVLRVRAETLSEACRAQPRVSAVPVALGPGRLDILVTDAVPALPAGASAVYTVHLQREAPPSLPVFGDHMTCAFLQDCALVVDPGLPCGLEPWPRSADGLPACPSGHAPGRWLVPCLSCSDNRTCDWREAAWQPDGCRHPSVDAGRLRECMAGSKVLFLGDSTNRGMMYFLTERLNRSLAAWERSHGTLLYRDVNGGRTPVAYSYYPRFWLERGRRPTFGQALTGLLRRSRPLVNSRRTVLVVGGVQWLTTDHLRTVREVLDRESLAGARVVIKSLGMGFHLPADGIRAHAPEELRELSRENRRVVAAAERLGYEAIDTLAITMGRYKEFLQGACACHFHQVEKAAASERRRQCRTAPPCYHVRGPVNQIYSEILLSRLFAFGTPLPSAARAVRGRS
ncbi:cadherin-like and PC-esterase domain-containing protein 1 [Hippocampus comes]|uniref:cadherin-like and PC-esterase domain-containing protein 1 n=1 Tax=Hippocampus comes TaxID=109280 RepID=UPI00094E75D4|nr:PREDICTED: cadherin-like and PC-esterase domain-containing protein 1 [Hippocampus comes]